MAKLYSQSRRHCIALFVAAVAQRTVVFFLNRRVLGRRGAGDGLLLVLLHGGHLLAGRRSILLRLVGVGVGLLGVGLLLLLLSIRGLGVGVDLAIRLLAGRLLLDGVARGRVDGNATGRGNTGAIAVVVVLQLGLGLGAAGTGTDTGASRGNHPVPVEEGNDEEGQGDAEEHPLESAEGG